MAIYFFAEDVSFPLKSKTLYKHFVKVLCENHRKKAGDISIVFCSDAYLYKMNMQYLQHDDYTDIITFDAVEGDLINGDIFISTERVFDNASQLQVEELQELTRVIAHGILHLCGFKDKTASDKLIMRQQEQQAIEEFTKIEQKIKLKK